MAHSNTSKSLHDTHLLASLGKSNIAIVCTEWNEKIVAELASGCERTLKIYNGNVLEKLIVPGSFELPFSCRALWSSYADKTEKPEAIIAFGAVIRGGTPHFDFVAKAVTEGILQLNLTLPVPVIFGVLTLDNEAQAWERLGGTQGHKGEEAAIAALKMVLMNRGRMAM